METYLHAFRSRYANADIVYASKAFLNKEAVRIVADEGLCLDVSGGGELALALATGFPAERIFMHGNNKTPRELREAISAGVGRIVIDSRIELRRISQIAGELGVEQAIYLRITPGVEADTHQYIRTGCEDSKFGFTMREDFAFRCVADVLATPNVRLAGLHCHIGSQIFALHSYPGGGRGDGGPHGAHRAGIRHPDRRSSTWAAAWAWRTRPPTGRRRIDQFAETVTSAVHEACARHGVAEPRLLAEPGRSLVANAGVTLYTVGIIKTLPNIRKYVAVDGGMSDNVRTALYHADYEPVVANKAGQPRTEIVTIAGKHCESGDAVVIDMPLQHVDVGDIVAVFGTGAYNHTMASNYNGQPRPAIVFVKDGKARVTTRRETYDDLMSRDI